MGMVKIGSPKHQLFKSIKTAVPPPWKTRESPQTEGSQQMLEMVSSFLIQGWLCTSRVFLAGLPKDVLGLPVTPS
jgi:hypothetical protein